MANATFTNNNIGTNKNDEVFVNGLGVMTGGTTASGNMKKNNGAKAVGADLDYSEVNYDYEDNETNSSFLEDTGGIVLKEGSRKNTKDASGKTVEASTWGQSLVPKTTGTFMYNGGISKNISEVGGEDTYRVYVENGSNESYNEKADDGKGIVADTLISSGVTETIANELIRQQKAYIIGNNVLAARGSLGDEYSMEKIVKPQSDQSQ